MSDADTIFRVAMFCIMLVGIVGIAGIICATHNSPTTNDFKPVKPTTPEPKKRHIAHGSIVEHDYYADNYGYKGDTNSERPKPKFVYCPKRGLISKEEWNNENK